MNQGQFEAITSRLDRLIELLEEQTGNGIDRMNEINKSYGNPLGAHESPVTEEQPKPAAKPAKRGKAA